MAPGSESDLMKDGRKPGRLIHPGKESIRVDDALAVILSKAHPLPAVELAILDCLGLVLASDVRAEHDVPPFANSAMDGYAVRSQDTEGATPSNPLALAIVSTIQSGVVSSRILEPGEAARIMTGAPIPTGADAVVRQESVVVEPGDRVRLARPVAAGENVRPAGEDIRSGTVVMTSGTPLDAAGIGVLASLGRATATVHRRPSVGILSTGDEVVPPGEPLRPGQIRDSNSSLLAALVQESGGNPVLLGVARDELGEMRSRLRGMDSARLDFIISSGGVSVGDFDLVKDALAAEGRVDCWQILIKPGKPLAFGSVNEVPFLGLPGNPVAAYVGFLQFARPLIRKLLGNTDILLPELTARLASDCDGAGDRRHYLRGRLRWENGWVAEPILRGGSGVLSSLLGADCLIVIAEECQRPRAGDAVTVQLLRPGPATAMVASASGSTRPDGH